MHFAMDAARRPFFESEVDIVRVLRQRVGYAEVSLSTSWRLHAHRAARCDRHHCYPGCVAVARTGKRKREGAPSEMREQLETNRAGINHFRTGTRALSRALAHG